MNTNPLVDNPFVSDNTDRMEQNSGQTIRERTDAEEHDPFTTVEHDEYPGTVSAQVSDAARARIESDFEWRKGSNGKEYLSARPHLIARYEQQVPRFIAAAQLAFRDKQPERHSEATQLGQELANYIDAVRSENEKKAQYLGRTLATFFAGDAITAYSMAYDCQAAKSRQRPGQQTPDWLIQRMANAATRIEEAAYFATHLDAAGLKVDWKNAAYDAARRQAYNNQRYLSDPNRGEHGAVNESATTDALISNMLGIAA